jgi:hypothetical protein
MMRHLLLGLAAACAIGGGLPAQQPAPAAPADPVRTLVGRLDLEKYKGTVKGLTQFGDRRQGTERNRKAVDWMKPALRHMRDRAREVPSRRRSGTRAAAAPARGRTRSTASAAYGLARAPGSATTRCGSLNACAQQEPAKDGDREVYCTKVGATRPDGYASSARMDGTAGRSRQRQRLRHRPVMELARVFSNPDVQTERSIRFALWNNEESGLNGARAYIAQRQAMQGKEDPPGSGRYPEPKWLGMIQHDMMMFDHGMPRADGTLNPEQRPEAA